MKIKVIDNKDVGKRIDKYLTDNIDRLSRSKIQKLIENNKICVNESYIKPNYKLRENDKIQILSLEEDRIEIIPEDKEVDIVYEDKDILIINKPANLIVHPSRHQTSNTLVNRLVFKINHLSNAGEYYRPGIVHRLDKNTSGLMVVAKNNNAYYNLIDEFKNARVKRYYLAIVDGKIEKKSGKIDLPIGRDVKDRTRMSISYKNGKRAITKYKVKKEYDRYSLLELELLTGRMHQIRVHMNYLKIPVVGDEKYGKKTNDSQLLHAYKLGFFHPRTKEFIEFNSNMPKRFLKYME